MIAFPHRRPRLVAWSSNPRDIQIGSPEDRAINAARRSVALARRFRLTFTEAVTGQRRPCE